MSDVWMLRTGIVIAGVLLMAAIYFFGRPRRPGQGRRIDGGRGDGQRVEPTIGEQLENELAGEGRGDAALQSEMDLPGGAASSDLGRRASEDFD
jgi:cell division protein ZipA